MTLRRARWLMLAVPASLYVFSWLHRVAPAVVASDLMRTFEITATSLGNLSAIYPYVFAIMALVAGSLADTLGPRWTITLGGTTMGLGAILFGVAPSFPVAFVGRLLVGLGASVLLISWLALSAAWFRPNEFGTISGLTQTVGTVGALAAATPLAVLVHAVGWRATFVMIGGLTLFLAGIAAALVRNRPQALGLPAVNPDHHHVSAPTVHDVVRGVPGILANPRTWPPVLTATGVYTTQITLLGLWGVPYLVQVYGLSRLDASTLVSMIAIGMGTGAPLIGWLSDRRLGRRRVPMIACATLYALCWIPLALPGAQVPVPLLAPLFLVLGLTSSGLVLVWSCVREVNDPARVGIAVGFCNLPIFLAIALLQWLTGVILDANWGGSIVAGARVYPAAAWSAAFTVCLGLTAAAVVCALLVTETHCRNAWQRPAR